MRLLYPQRCWQMPDTEKRIYLSFDDGPHPRITPWVLDQLRQYQARASFFCIGKNVKDFPGVYEQVLKEGHVTGNHSMHHLDGWKTSDANYLADVQAASKWIDSPLYRPPYGKMTSFQAACLQQAGYRHIMWSVLSGDFDRSLSDEQCWKIVEKNTRPGSIIVYHDSEKAEARLRYALPRTLEHFSRLGYVFAAIEIAGYGVPGSNK